MIVLIDNYDSFTWNLVQYFGDLGEEVRVFRNDKIDVAGVMALNPAGVVLSPGPGDPDSAGICLDLTRHCATHAVPLFGVCLGMQTLGQALGGRVERAPVPMHGKISPIHHKEHSVFAHLPSPFQATRYHSLVVTREDLPEVLEITAWTEDGLIMGLAHRHAPLHAVQFHPESIATEHGHILLKNFVNILPN